MKLFLKVKNVLNDEKKKEKIGTKPVQFKICKHYDIKTVNEIK